MTSSRPFTSQRDATFDIMKGIGILLVMTAHFFSWNHPLLGRFINSFHMPMFFIVAGYFSKSFSNWGNAKLQVKKYIKRLLPAAIFTQSALILWAVVMALTKDTGWDPVIQQTLSFLWADPHGPTTQWGPLYIGVIWFLIAVLISKTILLFLSRLDNWAIPLSLLLAAASVALFRVFPYSIWCISLGLTALPFVTFGWWCRTHIIPRWLIIICIICWFLAISFSELNMFGFIWKCFPLDILGACGGTFFLYLSSKILSKTKLCSKVFATLGVWSLAIMCFHNLEVDCHLGNHVRALFPFTLPIWGKYLFQYVLTIVMASISTKIPVLNRVFI